MMDSGIAAWDVKRYYDSIRPISAIRFLYAGKQVQAWGGPFEGTLKIDGATWRTYIPVTPPFAEFVSGHSAVSSAAADVLKSSPAATPTATPGRSQQVPRESSRASRRANRLRSHGRPYASRPRGWDVAALRRHPHL